MKRNSIAPQHRTIRPHHAAHIVAALFAIVGTAACAPERTARSSANTETHTSTMNHEVSNFSTDVVERSHTAPVLVDFWAPWCGPCRALKPTLEKLAAEPGVRWTLVTVNVDEHPELAEQFGIRGIPNVKLFSAGAPIAEFSGSMPEGSVRTWLDQSLPK